MAYGTLSVHVTAASSALPLQGASVTAGNITKITDTEIEFLKNEMNK